LWIAIQNHLYLIVEKFDLQQLISSALMIVSLIYVISAVRTMRKKGKASRQRGDETLFGFERITVMIESGIFRHIRHPMYSSLIFLVWGLLLRNIEVALIIIALIATFFCVYAANIEEKENIEYFGERYLRYMQRTKMFIPHIV
jgi:protein-S-isoprenylcysteine O-methyltransferase Ste14